MEFKSGDHVLIIRQSFNWGRLRQPKLHSTHTVFRVAGTSHAYFDIDQNLISSLTDLIKLTGRSLTKLEAALYGVE